MKLLAVHRKAGMSRPALLILLCVSLLAVAVVLYLALRADQEEPERIISLVEVETPEEADVNVSEVVDTLENPDVQAEEGERYKVLIVDQAREGASGIARIGGLVTFVPDTMQGDLVVIEVTRIRRSTADAVVIEQLDSGVAVPGRPPTERPVERRRPAATSGLVGQSFEGMVEDIGQEGDGIVRVDGKVVFVEGASLGDYVRFTVVNDMDRFAIGQLEEKLTPPDTTDEPVEDESTSTYTPADPPEDRAMSVTVGSEYEVLVEEPDRGNPEVDGVARIDGLVVFVPGTRPGDRVRIRITALQRRSASSEVLEHVQPEE